MADLYYMQGQEVQEWMKVLAEKGRLPSEEALRPLRTAFLQKLEPWRWQLPETLTEKDMALLSELSLQVIMALANGELTELLAHAQLKERINELLETGHKEDCVVFLQETDAFFAWHRYYSRKEDVDVREAAH